LHDVSFQIAVVTEVPVVLFGRSTLSTTEFQHPQKTITCKEEGDLSASAAQGCALSPCGVGKLHA
jgi:hypothetical protein